MSRELDIHDFRGGLDEHARREQELLDGFELYAGAVHEGNGEAAADVLRWALKELAIRRLARRADALRELAIEATILRMDGHDEAAERIEEVIAEMDPEPELPADGQHGTGHGAE